MAHKAQLVFYYITNYSSNLAGVFLYKSNSRAKHNWHCIIGSLINAALLDFYFILHYHFFLNLFFWMFIFQWMRIRISLYVFWLRNRPLIKYVRNCWGDGHHPKRAQLRTGEGDVTPCVCVQTHTIYFHVFGSIYLL